MTETLLSERVDAPAVLRAPMFAGLIWRAATMDDVDSVTALMQAGDAVDHPEYLQTREEIATDFEASYTDLSHDTIVGVSADIDGAGRIVAYGSAILGPSRQIMVRSIVHGMVDPEFRGRGIGRVVLDWQEKRARQQLASCDTEVEGWIEGFQSEGADDTIHLFERFGFSSARFYLQLRRDLAKPIDAVELPEGFLMGAASDGYSDAIRLAKNDAFRDHWGSLPMNKEQWAKFAARPTVRPDLSVVVRGANGDIAGFVLVDVNENDWPGQGFSSGYIELVGVPRAYRGRGIAPAMLVKALAGLRDAGLDCAVLDVDSASPTGAVGLYERVGFAESGRSRALTKVF